MAIALNACKATVWASVISLVVAKDWRNKGLGTILTQHLIQQANQLVYLECLGDRLANFYQRLGFAPVSWQNLPRSPAKVWYVQFPGWVIPIL